MPSAVALRTGPQLKLRARLMIPLVKNDRFGTKIDRLHPMFAVPGQTVVLSTADMSGFPADELSQAVADPSPEAATILHTIDFLLSGF